MTKKKFPLFPSRLSHKGKIRENTYHFIIQGSASLEKWGKLEELSYKFRFSSIHFYHIKKPPFQILLYPKGRAFSINILPFRKSVPAVHFPNFSVYSYIS